jgi:predicted RNA binding protein YcfA (HicA-like mRNA interferase family)
MRRSLEPNMSARDLIRLAERDGWTVRYTAGGHLRLEHPDAAGPVFATATPSDHRAARNTLAQMRRALPPEDREERKAPRPRRQPKPKPTDVDAAIEMQTPPRPPRSRPALPGAPRLKTTKWPCP